MVLSNVKAEDFKKSEKSRVRNGVQMYYARFNERTEDGITYFVEHEIDHKPAAADYTALQAQWLARCKSAQVLAIEGYAKGADVKSFTVNGNAVWLDSEARSSIAKAVADKRKAGRTETVIYLGGVGYTCTLDKADEVLSTVEVYASDCYEQTENHKAAVVALETAEAVLAYDYATGYPERPAFEL